jgi:hypothetical protein
MSGSLNVIVPELASALVPRNGDIGTTALEKGCQFFTLP